MDGLVFFRFRIAYRFLLLTALALLSATSIAESHVNLDHVTKQLENAVEREMVRAAVVATFDAGTTEFIGIGQIDDAHSQSPDEETVFEIGSISKVFTALLIQTLVDSDELSWDSTIQEVLPGVSIANEQVQQITLRELAIHSSGLPRLPTNMDPEDLFDPYADYDSQLLESFLAEFDPESLNKQQAYSNLGFGLLGHIATRVGKATYSDLMNEDVLKPLDMSHSSTQPTKETLEKMAVGFSGGATMPSWNFSAMAGAGSLLSSAKDLIVFVEKNVEVADSPIHDSLRNLRKPQVMPNQGLAWALSKTDDGKPVFWHSGTTGGYASFLAISPQESRGWVILTTSTESALITDLGLSFLGTLEKSDSLDFSPFVGVFELKHEIEDAPKIYITFFDRDGQLFGQASGQREFPLTHTGERSFKFDLGGIDVTFGEPVDGTIDDLDWTQGVQAYEGVRVDESFGISRKEEIELSENTLKEYPGRYRLPKEIFPTGEIFLTIVYRDGQLYGQVTGQPFVPIFAMEKDRFFYKVADAEILFERDENGFVEALTLFQNGEHKATRVEDEE